MRNLRLLCIIGLLGIVQCTTKEEDPGPNQNTNTNVINTDSNYVEYYMNGIKQTPGIISAGIISNSFQFVVMDTIITDEATGIFINFNPVGSSPNVYSLPDTIESANLNFLALSIGQGTGNQPLVYYSSMCQDRNNNNAKFEITAIDYTTSFMSGTFEGKLCYNVPFGLGDSTEYVITNGKFNNIKFIH